MTQKKIIDAYKALQRLATQPMPIKTAYALHKLRQRMKPAFDFQAERERALMDELQPAMEGESQLRFKSAEDAQRWVAAMEELAGMETEIEIEPVTVAMADGITISPDDIGALDGVVIFEE